MKWLRMGKQEGGARTQEPSWILGWALGSEFYRVCVSFVKGSWGLGWQWGCYCRWVGVGWGGSLWDCGLWGPGDLPVSQTASGRWRSRWSPVIASNWEKSLASWILQVICPLNLFLREGYNGDALWWVIQAGIQTLKFLECVVRGLDIWNVAIRIQAGIFRNALFQLKVLADFHLCSEQLWFLSQFLKARNCWWCSGACIMLSVA